MVSIERMPSTTHEEKKQKESLETTRENRFKRSEKIENIEIVPLEHNPLDKQGDDTSEIILTSKPISMTRTITFKRSPLGIPIIRELIVIETEASLSRVLSLFFSFFVYALIFQIFISLWKKFHAKSNTIFITGLIFIFPPIFALYIKEFFFIVFYFAYMVLILKIYLEIHRKPMRKNTPKKTYRIFRMLYRLSYLGTIFSQALLLIGFFLNFQLLLVGSVIFLFLSLYFGLLTREILPVFFEKMAINIGYYAKEGVPEKKIKENICAICDEKEDEIFLSCGHCFGKECIKGWIFMGKKGFCPCCRENVDFGRIEVDFLEKGENFYGSFVDYVRKGVVFLFFFMVLVFFNRRK